MIKVQEVFDEASIFAEYCVLNHFVTETIAKTHMYQHDYEETIKEEASDCEEPRPAGLDVNSTFHLQVKKQTYIQKIVHKEATPIGGHHTFTYKGPSSIMSITKKFKQKAFKHLTDPGEDIIPKPLITGKPSEEDRIVVNFRKKKEREEQLKEEERLKQLAIEQKMRELDQQSKKEDKSLQKKHITYDSNGVIIFVKSVRADGLPDPVLNPPFKIKVVKHQQKTDQSKNDMDGLNSSQFKSFDSQGRRKGRLQLLNQIDLPQTKNEIVPMGSVFDETVPEIGITLIEQGKTKYGQLISSRKQLGQMSLEEYRANKESTILSQDQTIIMRKESLRRQGSQQSLQDQTQSKGQSLPRLDLPFHQLSTAQLPQTFYNTNESRMLSGFGHNQSQSGFRTARDKVLLKREISKDILVDNQYTLMIEDSQLYQSSYVETFRDHQRKVSFGVTQYMGSQTARNQSVMLNSIRNLKLIPLQKVPDADQNENHNDEFEAFKDKNKEIITMRNWGEVPVDNLRKGPKQIQKKPVFMELKKSNSQTLLTSRRKERNFVKSLKERLHLPPPPLGKTVGHGISKAQNEFQLTQIL